MTNSPIDFAELLIELIMVDEMTNDDAAMRDRIKFALDELIEDASDDDPEESVHSFTARQFEGIAVALDDLLIAHGL